MSNHLRYLSASEKNLADRQRPNSPSTKILYIDDDPLNRTLVSRLLTNHNFDVLEAENGLEGITIAQTELPGLILMDINMPGLDGHETTTRMRTISALKQTPIVAVTARTTKGERELALAAGCDGYIPKPIDVDAFPQQVISYLHGYKDTITPDERQQYLGHYNQKLVERLEAKVVELEEANRKLQKIDKLKSDFITLAAHELRTPISLIHGYARLLHLTTDKFSQDNTGKSHIIEFAGKIFDSVRRLTEVVNDILNISLIEANEMSIAQEPVDLAKVIRAALEELNPAKHGRDLNISLESLDDLPPITGDPRRLQQTFWNILSNAIKFTPDGGSIWLTGEVINRTLSCSKQDFRASGSGQRGILVSVKDTGIGIDPSEQKEIFERFYVIGDTAYHSSSKVAFGGGGIGLGLPIARGIVEAHGGRIWVESAGQHVAYNPGSTFYIFLPFELPD